MEDHNIKESDAPVENFLVLQVEGDTPITYPITKDMLIGRAINADIYLPDQEVSKEHAKIIIEPATHHCYLVDVGSTNGTILRRSGKPDKKLRRNQKTLLDHMYTILIANYVFVFQESSPTQEFVITRAERRRLNNEARSYMQRLGHE